MSEKLVDGLTVEERLEGLEFGFHNCRLEGLVLPKNEHDQLRQWVLEGRTSDEIAALILAKYKQPSKVE